MVKWKEKVKMVTVGKLHPPTSQRALQALSKPKAYVLAKELQQRNYLALHKLEKEVSRETFKKKQTKIASVLKWTAQLEVVFCN